MCGNTKTGIESSATSFDDAEFGGGISSDESGGSSISSNETGTTSSDETSDGRHAGRMGGGALHVGEPERAQLIGRGACAGAGNLKC